MPDGNKYKTQINEIYDLANNAYKFGMSEEDVLVGYFGAKIFKNMIERDIPFTLLGNEDNIRTMSEINTTIPASAGSIKEGIPATEASTKIDPKLAELLTLRVGDKDIAFIPGVTFNIDYNKETQEIQFRIINDDGDIAGILSTGILDGQDTKPVKININTMLNELNEDVDQSLNILDARKDLRKIENGINRMKMPIYGTVIQEPNQNWESERIKKIEDINEMFKYFGEDTIKEWHIEDSKKELLSNVSFHFDMPLDKDINSLIRTPYTNTANIVHDASQLIANALPAGNVNMVKQALYEIAYVESRHGQHKNTYKNKNSNQENIGNKINEFGIWQNVKAMQNIRQQLNLRGDDDTKLVANAKILEELINKYIPEYNGNFSFKTIKRQDLRFPLVSCAIARLDLANKSQEPISDKGEGRAIQWKKHYNTEEGDGTVAKYLKDINSQEFQDSFFDLTRERMPLLYMQGEST